MSRSLTYIGLALIAAALWLMLAGAAGWIPEANADALGLVGALGGAACLGLAGLARLLGAAGRQMRQSRCSRCGAPTERGQVYCWDHLRSTVNEFRDQARKPEPAPRARAR